MELEQLEDLLDEVWQSVRRQYYFPALPRPIFSEEISNGAFVFENLQILLNEGFIRGFEKKGLAYEEVLDEVLGHETAHFMKYPGSPLTILRMLKAVNDIEPGKANILRSAFTEAQTNLHRLMEMKCPHTAKIRKSLCVPENDTFNRILYGLYQTISGQDFGIQLNKEESDLVERLKDIEYLDKDIEIYSFRKFAEIMKDVKINDKGGKGINIIGIGNAQGDNGIKIYSPNQISQAVKAFALECKSLKDFENAVKAAIGEGLEKEEQGDPADEDLKGLKAGTGRALTQIASNIYTALADGFSIPIKKRPMKKNGGLFPQSHEPFELGSSFKDIDPFSSPGVLPGITKKWVRAEGESYMDEERVPDSVIVIDNSPSMSMGGSPSQTIYPHIVGATAIANAYLENGAKVAIYSFGSEDKFLPFSTNKARVHAELRRYSKDGGTTYSAEYLENLLKDSENQLDFSFISDMQISNLDDFVKSILSIPNMHRLHLLCTHPETYPYLLEKFKTMPHIAVALFSAYDHIRDVVMGEIGKSIK